MFKRIAGKLTVFILACGVIIGLGAGNSIAAENTIIDQEKINKAIGLHIEKNMPWPQGSMRFEVLSGIPEIALPKGNVSWKVEIKGNDNYLGDTYFIVKLYNKGVLFKEEPIRVRIEVLNEFVVSIKNLGRDSVISANDIAVQKKWVRAIPVNSVSCMDEVVGKLLVVNIRPNTEISRNMLKEVTAVKRGKMVQIILDSGAMNITTMGLSEEDGAEGSFVKVRNITSNKIIYARVVGESKVRVDFK
jgi:flagellar basal body P-ring formation protein FlgA